MFQTKIDSSVAVPGLPMESANANTAEGNTSSCGYNFRRAYMSAFLLLGISGSLPSASAHGAAFTTAMPLVPPIHTNAATNTASHLTSVWSHKASVTSQTMTVTGAGALNLGSPIQSFTATQIGSFNTVTLDLGGKLTTFDLGGAHASQLTAAELVSAAQIAAGGHQTLTLNNLGEAVGGSVVLNQKALTSLDSALGGGLTSLLIPQNVTLVDKVSDLSLSGNLVNYGKIQVGANTAGGGDIISAADTYNLSGGSISSARGADLSLVDSQSLVNSGNIASGHNLIINSANVTNAGSITAQNGNVNFTTLNQLTLNNANGIVQASNNVNVRDASYSGTSGITITGGTIASQNLNLFSGTGAVNTSGVNVTGIINTNAGAAHVVTDSKNLIVGNTNVSGDPLFANQGNIIINGNIIGPQNGAPLSFVASGNIVSAGGSLDTSSATGNGGQLNLIAGANFTSTGNGQITLTNSAQAVGGGSATGGIIDLTGKNGGTAPITAITTATTASGFNAGNITMVAFAGSSKGSGTITLPSTVTVNASGTNGTSDGGNVTLIAGASSGTAISTGNINTSGGQNHQSSSAGNYAGSILMETGIAVVSGISVTENGGLSSAINSTTATTNGNIITGSLFASSGIINVNTGGNFAFNNIDVSGYGGNAVSLDASNGGNVTITANNTSGNSIYAYGGGGAGGGSGSDGFNGAAGGYISISGPTAATGSLALTGTINVAGGCNWRWWKRSERWLVNCHLRQQH
jgi:hypothetical protein